MLAQFALVVGLQPGLRAGERCTDRVIDEVQRKPPGLAVAEAIEKLETLDARIKYPLAALRVDIFRRVARHRSHDLNLVLRE
ncbi:MAG: hypothetical protein ABI939_12270, partial [Anaerolineaceae bacterium]